MSEERSEEEQRDDAGVARVDSTLRIYLGDTSLWPVLFAGLATFTTFGTWLLWMVFEGRNPFGAAALLLLLGMSIDLWVRDLRGRRFGATSRVVLAWWLACIAGTVALRVAF